MRIAGAELGGDLRRHCASGCANADVAKRVVDLLFEMTEQGSRTFPLVRAFITADFKELDDDLRNLARADHAEEPIDDNVRCLRLVATRGEIAEWNDVAKSVHHRVIPLSPHKLERAPMIAELVRALDLRSGVPNPDGTFHVGDARASEHVGEPGFVKAYEIASIFGFGASDLTGQTVAVVVFSRKPIDESVARSFELVALSMKTVLVDSHEAQARVSDAERSAARLNALEELCAAQADHCTAIWREAQETAHSLARENQRRAREREREVRAETEKAQRSQRAILNVIDDLREARSDLEARVEERTQRIEELLELERGARREAEAARQQAETANRLKDEFLTTVSHELRTPLNAMLGWATLLKGEKLDAAKRASAIETIERNARAQVRLIEDLLDLGRILQGKFRLALGPIEVVPLIEAALESVGPSADAKGIRLQRVLDSHATVLGDAERIQQIAWNLLSNAIKFTPRGGRVLVTLRRAPSYVELAVEDTGQGIAPEFLAHVFEPFRQADGAISRRAGGLGLGLSIVRSLVELHGGTVTVTSDGAGKGATFTVRIPIAPVRASATPTETKQVANDESGVPPPTFECPPELVGLRVLVIDDEKDTRDLIAFILGGCRALVTTAGSAAEAIAALDSAVFDVIVSDVGLPDEDGLAFMRRVRQRPESLGGALPAIALTAYARTEDRTQALRAGFNVHLAKPVDPSELTLVIAAAIRTAR